jgi:hypothetical protein
MMMFTVSAYGNASVYRFNSQGLIQEITLIYSMSACGNPSFN